MKRIRGRNIFAMLAVATLGASLFVVSAAAQVRGRGARASAPRKREPSRLGQRARLPDSGRGRNFDGSQFLPYDYSYPDYDYDEGPVTPEGSPIQPAVAPPAQPRVAAPVPVEPLLLEYSDGYWVRVPIGDQIPTRPEPTQSDSMKASNLRPGATNREETVQPLAAEPRAVLVFRDGHQEAIERYLIQGDVIYASVDYWNGGSWTREIPIGELNIAATLKLNKERGGKFKLPSGPSEIILHF